MAPRFASRRRVALACLLLLTLLLSLSCITNTLTVQVTHNYEPGQEQQVWVEMLQEMDPVFANEAKAANTDIRARCQAAGVDCTAALLPETLSAFLAQPEFSGWTFDSPGEGFDLTQTEDTVRARKGWSWTEYQEMLKTEEGADQPKITIRQDAATGATYYTIEFAFGEAEDSGETEFDWTEWEAFLREPEPPKPDVIPAPTPEGAGASGEDLAGALTGVEEMLGSLASDIEGPGMELQSWYYQHILRQMGFPIFLKIVLDPPGQVTSHTVNGQPAGVLRDADGEVVFAVDEAFLRAYGGKLPWVFRVESVVEAGQKEPTPRPVDAEIVTRIAGERFHRFRIRLVNSKSFTPGVGIYSADYVLQELDEQLEPGRQVRIRFTGYGLGLGAGYGGTTMGGIEDWTEFEVRDAPMALEDFDGVKGWHVGGGAVVKSITSAKFCTRDSYTQVQASWQGPSTQIGLYAGFDWSWGTWRIVDYQVE